MKNMLEKLTAKISIKIIPIKTNENSMIGIGFLSKPFSNVIPTRRIRKITPHLTPIKMYWTMSYFQRKENTVEMINIITNDGMTIPMVANIEPKTPQR